MSGTIIPRGISGMTTEVDSRIRQVLRDTRVIAVVGASSKEIRPSHSVMRFLLARGYRCIPVNPGLAGKEILGQTVYASLADIPEPVDMVDVFRASEAVAELIEETLALPDHPRTVWLQLGVSDDAASAKAEAAGLEVVRERCPAIEIPRLFPAGWKLGD